MMMMMKVKIEISSEIKKSIKARKCVIATQAGKYVISVAILSATLA